MYTLILGARRQSCVHFVRRGSKRKRAKGVKKEFKMEKIRIFFFCLFGLVDQVVALSDTKQMFCV